jgi:hypothetical protein
MSSGLMTASLSSSLSVARDLSRVVSRACSRGLSTYGKYDESLKFAAVVPSSVACLGIFQLLLSLVLIFLFLLAVRNHFRIK